jgi:hypothetical protein
MISKGNRTSTSLVATLKEVHAKKRAKLTVTANLARAFIRLLTSVLKQGLRPLRSLRQQ